MYLKDIHGQGLKEKDFLTPATKSRFCSIFLTVALKSLNEHLSSPLKRGNKHLPVTGLSLRCGGRGFPPATFKGR